jgi:hypothetical protein
MSLRAFAVILLLLPTANVIGAPAAFATGIAEEERSDSSAVCASMNAVWTMEVDPTGGVLHYASDCGEDVWLFASKDCDTSVGIHCDGPVGIGNARVDIDLDGGFSALFTVPGETWHTALTGDALASL